MEIHFLTTDHIVSVEKVAEQHIGTKYSKCNSLRVISHMIILGKSAIIHSLKSRPKFTKPKNTEERKNLLGEVIYQKCVTVVVSEKTVTHLPMHSHMDAHMVQIVNS